MNDKINVLKEIKQLRLGELPADEADAPPPWAKTVYGPLRGLSHRERAAWWVVLVCGLVLVGVVKAVGDTYWSPGCDASLTSEGCVTLAADGSGRAVTEMSFVYQMESPDSIDFDAPKEAVLRFTDGRGRELFFTTSPRDGDVRYNVSLGRHVFSGHRFSYTRQQDRLDYATRQGDVWTYSMDYSYDCNTNEFAETVVLPEGAEIVSATPWPVANFTLNNKPTVRFEATRGRNEPFKYTVQYRLPAAPSDQKAAD